MAGININTNVASLTTQRRLSESNTRLRKSFEQLSSGLRITRASDDAAGLSISSLLQVDSRIYAQAVRNLNDGASMLSVAEGALEQLSQVTTRQIELAEQAANGTLTLAQRKALHAEAASLTEEYNRIVRSVSFNTEQILDLQRRELESTRVQAGYGSAGGIDFALGNALGRNVGLGTFTATISAAVDSPSAQTLYDLNGDGNLDIALFDTGLTEAVTVYLGNGDGTFKNAVDYNTGSNSVLTVFSLEVGDFNNDSNPDLILNDVGGTGLKVLYGNQDGSFNAAQNIAVGMQPGALAVSDFNGDGYYDVAFGDDTAPDSIAIMLNDRAGGFSAAQLYSLTANASPRYITVADMNGDNKADLLLASNATNEIVMMAGNGDGSFAVTQNLMPMTGPMSAVAADFNRDGYLDVFGIGSESRLFLSNGDGTFSAQAAIVGGPVGRNFALLDINADGFHDLMSSNGYLLIGNGDGTFNTPEQAFTSTSQVSSGDFNNDGVSDVVHFHNLLDYVRIYFADTEKASTAAHISLLTQAEARASLPGLRTQLSRVSSALGEIGSLQSRFSSALANVQVAKENYDTAASQITDVDVAHEAASLVRNQILDQAASAILAQANQAPNLALDLLSNN